MKKSKLSEHQIVNILKEYESGKSYPITANFLLYSTYRKIWKYSAESGVRT